MQDDDTERIGFEQRTVFIRFGIVHNGFHRPSSSSLVLTVRVSMDVVRQQGTQGLPA